MDDDQSSSNPLDVESLAKQIIDDRSEDHRQPNLEALSGRYRTALQSLTPEQSGELLVILLDAIALQSKACTEELDRIERESRVGYWDTLHCYDTNAARRIAEDLFNRDPSLNPHQIHKVLHSTVSPCANLCTPRSAVTVAFVNYLDRHADRLMQDASQANELRKHLLSFKRSRSTENPARDLCAIRTFFFPDSALPIDPGEAWSDAAISDINSLQLDDRPLWRNLLLHCTNTKPSTPTQRWLRDARRLIADISHDHLVKHLVKWFNLYDKPRTAPHATVHAPHDVDYGKFLVIPHHEYIMKGLCWITHLLDDPALPRSLADLAVSAYRKPKFHGPRAMKLGNAAIYALAEYPTDAGLAELSRLQQRIKVANAQTMIRKAMLRVAERSGIAPQDIDELAVPTYGFTAVGVRTLAVGDTGATIRISDGSNRAIASMTWTNAKGRILKSPPAEVRQNHKDDLNLLKGILKDIGRMLPAQKDRIDSLFLRRKSWDYRIWRERYLDHPIIGTVARRLIWIFDDGQTRTAGAWLARHPDGPTYADGMLVLVDGTPYNPPDNTTVSLWHPIDDHARSHSSAVRTDALAWREFVEDRRIRQPFKQAHREIYLLSDEERAGATRSNRFEAHHIRQNQFKTLCISRGWRHTLMLSCAPGTPMPGRTLDDWGLRAVLTIDPAGDGDPVYPLLVTGALRFFPAEDSPQSIHACATGNRRDTLPATPIRLDDLPPLVLSEILRDVDLFVSVAGIGTDADGLIDDSERAHYTSDGDMVRDQLSRLLESRRDLIARLLPKLGIRDACTMTARHLVVLGRKRAYRIHLASGNVFIARESRSIEVQGVPRDLWAPRDQPTYTPFEGDTTLESIIAKALLLAHDDKITNPRILRQIEHSENQQSNPTKENHPGD